MTVRIMDPAARLPDEVEITAPASAAQVAVEGVETSVGVPTEPVASADVSIASIPEVEPDIEGALSAEPEDVEEVPTIRTSSVAAKRLKKVVKNVEELGEEVDDVLKGGKA